MLETELLRSSGQVAGVIFNLKNNFGWKDAQQLDHNVSLPREINIIGVEPGGAGEDSEAGE